MEDRDLRHLKRRELLEMLLAQVNENRKLKKQLDEMKAQLDDRQIVISEAGSIAEAALQLNGVFEAAEKAAGQYLENVRRISAEGEAVGRQIEEDARKKAEAICAEADEYSRRVRSQADQYEMKVIKTVQDFLRKKSSMRSQLSSSEEEEKT